MNCMLTLQFPKAFKERRVLLDNVIFVPDRSGWLSGIRLTALTLYVPGISCIRPRLPMAGTPRSNLDAPLIMHTSSLMTVSARVGFMTAQPRVIRGKFPVPTSSLSDFESTPYKDLCQCTMSACLGLGC